MMATPDNGGVPPRPPAPRNSDSATGPVTDQRPPTEPDPSIRLDDVVGIRDVQSLAAVIYGRMPSERALVWTMEELGELAQAVRRREGADRLAEELGQLAAWTYCLANILDIDLASAIHQAFSTEAARQIATHGQMNWRMST